MGYLSKAVTASASYLPAQVTDTLNQSRAFATVTVPSAGLPNIVTIASLSRQTRLMLASADGYFYIYNIPGDNIPLPPLIIKLIINNLRARRRLRDGEAAPG